MEPITLDKLITEAKKNVVEIDVIKTSLTMKDKSILLIDVREPDEYLKGHVKGSINIPRGVLEFRTDKNYPGSVPELENRSVDIVLYCRSGARSALAAKTMGMLGFSSVVSMAGGFLAWEAAQLPIEK